MALELGLMIDSNGGGFIWVHRAWGPFIGWVNGWNGMASSFINIGLLITLFPSYVPVSGLLFWQRFLISVAFVLVTVGINIVGFRWVSRLSGLFMFVLFSPFFGCLIWELVTRRAWEMDWSSLGSIPPWSYIQQNMSTYVGTVVWAFGGFDSLGSIAGEIQGGKRTFLLGLMFCMPLMLLNYAFPVVISYPLSLNYTNFTQWGLDQGKQDLTKVLRYGGTEWLGIWAIVGALCATFAQLSSSIMSFSRVVWAASKSTGKYKHYPSFFARWSWQRHTGTVRPIFTIVFVGVVGALLTLMEFSLIVQLYLVSRVINLMCLYTALIRLRFTEPDTLRPFRMPGGIAALIALMAPTVCISGVALYFADWTVWVVSAVAETVIVGTFFIRYAMLRYCCPEEDHLHGEPPEKAKKAKGSKHSLVHPLAVEARSEDKPLLSEENQHPPTIDNQRSMPTFMTGSIQDYGSMLYGKEEENHE